jgi:hypothetical protein
MRRFDFFFTGSRPLGWPPPGLGLRKRTQVRLETDRGDSIADFLTSIGSSVQGLSFKRDLVHKDPRDREIERLLRPRACCFSPFS